MVFLIQCRFVLGTVTSPLSVTGNEARVYASKKDEFNDRVYKFRIIFRQGSDKGA